jgi:ubiquilin
MLCVLGVHFQKLGMASVTLSVKCSTGTKFTITVELSQSVGDLKAMLVEQSGISIDQMRLIYRGHVLKDANSLQSYGEVTEYDTMKLK